MILLFKSGSVFSRSSKDGEAGSIFPLISIPTNVEGKSTELNDFQWWAYTDEWQQWLKKNPREWQAEAEDHFNNFDTWVDELLETEDYYRQFFNFQAKSLLTKGKISSFDDFLQIYEAEEKSANSDTARKFTKFIYAVESLVKSGVLKPKMEMDSLNTKTPYAVVVDLLDEKTKKPNPMARQAFRFKLIAKTKTITVAEIDYVLPQEEKVGETMEGYFKNVSEFVAQAMVVGVSIAGVYLVANAVGSIATGLLFRNLALKTYPGKAIGGWLSGGARATKAAFTSAFNAARGWFGASTAAGGGGVAAGGGALTTAGIVAGVVVVAGAIQRSINWFSSKQAPIYSKVDDFAKGNFAPGEIEIGKPITICWTQESGSGWLTSLVWNSDTRTTMDLIKIVDKDEKSFFLMTNVNSKAMGKVLKDNELVMLVFNNNDNFERGYLDNDDLEFESLAIKSMGDLAVATSFYGYCDWSEMQSAFDEAPERAWYVPENAPSSYEFNYQNQKSEKINVSGKLMTESDLESSGVEKFLPDISGALKESGVKENFDYSSYEKFQETRLVDFYEFSSLYEENKEDKNKKDKKEIPDAESLEKEWVKNYKDDSRTQKATKEFEKQHEDSKFKRCMMSIYRVNSIEWVDPNVRSQVPTIQYFVVAPQSFDAKIGDPVAVEPTSEDKLYNPRFGLATYTPPEEKTTPEKTDKDKEKGEEIPPLTPGSTGPEKKIKVDPDDISIRDVSHSTFGGRRRLVIKDDPDPKGENVNIADFLTPEDRKELGIENWKNVTKVQLVYDRDREPTKVVLKNRKPGFANDEVRRIRKGQAGFDAAVAYAKRVKAGIEYD